MMRQSKVYVTRDGARCSEPKRALLGLLGWNSIKSVIVPEAELATIVHAGPHTDIDRSYGALAAYVAEHALAVPGPIREYYLTDLADTPDRERWRTRIGWPIFQTTP
jgi:hypothetical protein